MNRPIRLQLSRKKGFNLQKLSLETNGLPVIVVSRPTKWGNPFRIGIDGTATQCVEFYRKKIDSNRWTFPTYRDIKTELKGKNLACFCETGTPCHADFLLKIANQP